MDPSITERPSVRHFDHLPQDQRDELFSMSPGEFDRHSSRTMLANALGATLYVPGVRDDLVTAINKRAAQGVRSVVIDLEDAVADQDVDQALINVNGALTALSETDQQTLIFVRVRTPEHIRQIVDGVGEAGDALTGFVLPKFSASTGARFLGEILAGSDRLGTRLFAMPVLETPDVLYRESRDEALSAIRDLLGQYRETVLAVRFGATDLCGLYGIRRDRDLSIYHVGVVAELISEVVNHLGRADGTGYVITGPVWEYFAGHERMFRPQLRATPFEARDATSFRHQLVTNDVDGLIREIVLDRANGLTGKTVIHPSHVAAVHALSVVPHEEFADASDILESQDAGVRASGYRNKMNEMRPHRRWAERIRDRAQIFGVANPEVSHVEILSALLDR
jgi:citrate lyase beta subunit